jgi:proteic killer suppression protein
LPSRAWLAIELPQSVVLEMDESVAEMGTRRQGGASEQNSNRKGQYSIRINEQFRICFKGGESGPFDVEIIDYH